MKKLILTLFVFLTFSHAVQAAETVTIDVNGMVCDFCARAIEKVFNKQEAVNTVHVDLSSKTISVQMKEAQTLNDEALKKLVTDAGYVPVTITRGQADE